MDYCDNALETNTVFYVLLRTATASHLCEIMTFSRFFKSSLAYKLVKEPKNIPHTMNPLILAEHFACKERVTFDLIWVNKHIYT